MGGPEVDMVRALACCGLLLIGAIIVALAPVAPAALEMAEASFQYSQGSSFAGQATLSCSAGVIYPAAAQGGSWTLDAAGGWWTHHAYEYNYTMARVPYWASWGHLTSERLHNETVPIAAGPVQVDWVQGGRVLLFGPLGGRFWQPDGPVQVNITASRYETAGADETVPRITAYESEGASIVQLPAPSLGLSRTVTFSDGQARITGPLTLLMEGASIQDADGRHLQVPNRVEFRTYAGDPRLVANGATIEHYARLDLVGAVLELDASRHTFHCQDLVGDLHGSLRLYQADGELRSVDLRTPFEQREVTLNGSFAFGERPSPQGVQGTVSGTFESASLDFQPAVVGGAANDAARIGFWALLAGAITAAGYQLIRFATPLFSRLDEERLTNHTTRRLILDTVHAQPNITLQELVARVGETRGEIRHHVRMLEYHGLVRSQRIGARRCLVGRKTIQERGRSVLGPTPETVGAVDPMVEAVAADARGPALMKQIVDNLRARFGVSKVGAWKAVRRAERHGFVKRVHRDGRIWIECA